MLLYEQLADIHPYDETSLYVWILRTYATGVMTRVVITFRNVSALLVIMFPR
jgi:hypothetical protein